MQLHLEMSLDSDLTVEVATDFTVEVATDFTVEVATDFTILLIFTDFHFPTLLIFTDYHELDCSNYYVEPQNLCYSLQIL